MFKKILIANRGEIAVRILRTCRDIGIPAVAVYSTADRGSLHVKMATEAVCIGGPQASESYMNQSNIISAALGSGCDAIHPGYGFLAENAAFAAAVRDAGLTFIGPSPETITLLGDKARARSLMIEAGVPVTPGSDGALKSSDEALELASKFGYPVLLKASSGGGGRGMRRVDRAEDLKRLYDEASKEAEMVFGDPNLYLEKLIEDCKHLEFQILADGSGNVIHLGERDCSLQRRRQKMLEESPSPKLKPEVRDAMGEAAVKAAKAADYLGAGTVEFVVKDDDFYFIEVNTRIQVEHPVTEAVTGLDLIAEQIRLAYGANVPLEQEDVELHGHAIEVRINAEVPQRDFAPSPGIVQQMLLPGGIGVRVDTMIYPGAEVSPLYDSMVAKIIVHGKDRREAIRRLRRALEEITLVGIETNTAFMYALMFERYFIRGDYTTQILENSMDRLKSYELLVTGEGTDEETEAVFKKLGQDRERAYRDGRRKLAAFLAGEGETNE